MELKRYADAAPFEFGDFVVRELSPDAFSVGSVAEIIVPMGAERTARVLGEDPPDVRGCDRRSRIQGRR